MSKKIVFFFLLIFSFQNAEAQYVDKFDMSKLVIQFGDASAEIIPTYIPLLYRLADTLNKNTSINVIIRGHVCCLKRNGLAKKRAKAVRYYLELFGVDPKRLKIKGMKNSEPVVFPETSKEDELKNMRVDFIFSTSS